LVGRRVLVWLVVVSESRIEAALLLVASVLASVLEIGRIPD
jgi:hypothetical protein